MIPVYIIPSPKRNKDNGGNTRNKLINFFKSCKIFKVIEVCELKNSIGLSDNAIEVNLIYNSLKDSYRDFPNLPCITILDTSTTNSSPDFLVKMISQIFPVCDLCDSCNSCNSCWNSTSTLYKSSEFSNSTNCQSDRDDASSNYNTENFKENKRKETEKEQYKQIYKCWDIAYLADWLDRCDLFKPIYKKNNCCNDEEKKDGKIEGEWVQTFSPRGLQALLWSERGRDIILGKECMKNGKTFPTVTPSFSSQLTFNIQNKNLRAITLSPPFFYFDITSCKLTRADLLKTCQCKIPDPPPQPVTIIPYLIFISVVVLVILIAWFFYQIWGKYH